MPSVEDKTFKLKWTVEDCSVCVDKRFNWNKWISTKPFPVDELGCTQWQMLVCLRTEDGYLNCIFKRFCWDEEVGNISFELSLTFLGKGGRMLKKTEMVSYSIKPTERVSINVIPTTEFPWEDLANDQLVVCCEIRQIKRIAPDIINAGLWKEDLMILSDDMRKLFQSAYLTDFALQSSDGSMIPVHFCVLFARWTKLKDAMIARPRRRKPRIVVCPHTTRPILAAFVFYIYTGTVPASDMTMEFFEFYVEQFPTSRFRCYTFPQEMSMRSIGLRKSIVFRWRYEEGGAPMHRILPFVGYERGEILVDISTAGSYLEVRFSVSVVGQLHCKAALVGHGYRLDKSADHYFNSSFDPWRFPDFIPMSLLKNGKDGIHVEFELTVSTMPELTSVESTWTDFETGSRGVNHVEMLRSGLDDFFQEWPYLDMCDLELRTEDGFFRSFTSVLGARSEVLRKLFPDPRKTSWIRLKILRADSDTLCLVLNYIYTGWTHLESIRKTLKIYTLAMKLSLHGLARKCTQYVSACVKKSLQ